MKTCDRCAIVCSRVIQVRCTQCGLKHQFCRSCFETAPFCANCGKAYEVVVAPTTKIELMVKEAVSEVHKKSVTSKTLLPPNRRLIKVKNPTEELTEEPTEEPTEELTEELTEDKFSKRVLILGLLDESELEMFPKKWKVGVLPHPARITKTIFQSAVANFRPNVILFQFFANQVNVVESWGLENIPCEKIAWFIDSHVSVCRQQELRVQGLFDKVYLTHSSYLSQFDNALWIPCGLKVAPYQPEFALSRLEVRPIKPKYDVVFLYASYEGQIPDFNLVTREQIIRKLRKELDRRKMTYYFGQERKEYIKKMLQAKVCLNISLAGDLNIRNFEILALGQKLVTDKTVDHDGVPGLNHFCTFFARNASARVIANTIQKAIKTPLRDREERVEFAKRHSNVVRCMQLILGRSFTVKGATQ